MVLHYVISWLRYGHVLISNILIFIFLLSLSAYGQQFPIQGTVRSAEHEEPLQGATIAIEGTSISTISDAKGHFELRSPHAEGVVHIKYIGYLPQRIPFSNEPLEVFLDQDDNRVEEVQVIGYGETTRRLNTGSVASVSAKEIEKQPVTNVLSALSGRMPGVFVQTTNGLPGGNINIQIRGTGSIQAGTIPLYIIDGVPYDGNAINESHALSSRNIAGPTNPLNIFNPNDIENITVLKDADATAIYGSRGSNGVVLITTKKGVSGRTRINLNVNQGFSKVTSHPRLLNLEEYLELRSEAFQNDGRTPSADPGSSSYAPDLKVWSQNLNTDWSEYIYGNTANLTSAQVSVSGGNDNTSFNISGNVRTEGTVMLGANRYIRGGLQSTLGHTSSNGRFKINLSTVYNTDATRLSNPANAAVDMLHLPPNYPLFNNDGSFNWYAGHNVEAQQLAQSHANTNNVLGNLFTTYSLPLGLDFKLSGGFNRRDLSQRQLFPIASLYPGEINHTLFGETSTSSFILEPQAEYRKSFHKSNLQILIGGTYQSTGTDRISIRASDFANESLMENLGSAGTVDTRETTTLEYRYISAFGRLTYNLLDKYILNATIRRDGSSRFGPNNQFGNFYSIGGAWLFYQERWLEGVGDLFSFGKLRASYGITGNDQIPDYQYLSTYQARGSNLYQGISVLSPSRIFNSDFHWEATKKFEIAAELGFVNDRIFLTMNYYRNRSSNQLVNYPLAKITGFSNYQANLPAVVQNTGWEFDIDARIIQNENFEWTASANVTFPKNKLVEFLNIENSSYANTLQVGYDITRIYGYELVNVDTETGIAQFTGEDGEISDNPYQFHTLGKRTPQFYGGLGTKLKYRSLELNVFGQFTKQMHLANLAFNQFGLQPFNSYQLLANRWRDVGDETNIPKVSSLYRNDTYYFGQSNGNLFSVPYFRLKNISLSYTLPNAFANKLGSQSIHFSVAVQNLFTVWDDTIPLVDPEVGGNAGLTSAIAPTKSVLFGFNVIL